MSGVARNSKRLKVSSTLMFMEGLTHRLGACVQLDPYQMTSSHPCFGHFWADTVRDAIAGRFYVYNKYGVPVLVQIPYFIVNKTTVV